MCLLRSLVFTLTLFFPLFSLGGFFSFQFSSSEQILSVFDEIERRIEEAASEGFVPVVVFDLDDTLFLNATRNAFYVRELALQDSRFFYLSRVNPQDFVGKTWDEWTKAFLMQHQFSSESERSDLRSAFLKVKGELRTKAISRDELIKVMADLAWRWSWRAQIVYLTARESDYADVTAEKLSADNLPPGRVVFKESSDEKSHLYKGRRLPEIISDTPRGRLIVTFDDEVKNLVEMERAVPSALHVRARTRLIGDAVVEVLLEPWLVTLSNARPPRCASLAGL